MTRSDDLANRQIRSCHLPEFGLARISAAPLVLPALGLVPGKFETCVAKAKPGQIPRQMRDIPAQQIERFGPFRGNQQMQPRFGRLKLYPNAAQFFG